MESAKFATSDALNVWVPLPTVLPAQLQDSCTMLLVGTFVQVSSMPVESVSTNAQPDISDFQTKNANYAPQNA